MPQLPPVVLEREEVEALLDAAPDTWHGRRTRALIVLLYRAGLRCNEALHVHVQDLRFKTPASVWVRQPKYLNRGAPQRSVGLDRRSVEIIEAWLELRGGKPGRLLVTDTGAPMLSSNVRDILPRLARRAGVNRRVHAHGLRHTFSAEVYREGIGIRQLQESLGHASLDTTAIYLRSIGATEAVAATAARSW